MRANMARQAVTANNLANAATTGFRAEMSSARPVWIKGPGLPDRAVASEEVLAADMRGAATVSTGRPLDIAMNGDAMLTVQAENGDEAYTRRGDLMVSASGLLTTGDGHPVLGEGGPVTVPPADQIRIDKDCTLWVVPGNAGFEPFERYYSAPGTEREASASGFSKHTILRCGVLFCVGCVITSAFVLPNHDAANCQKNESKCFDAGLQLCGIHQRERREHTLAKLY